MNAYRIAVFIFAGLCVLVALAIFYRKAVSPWLVDRDDAKARKIQEAERQATEWKRRQKLANGRTQRTGPPISRRVGGRDAS